MKKPTKAFLSFVSLVLGSHIDGNETKFQCRQKAKIFHQAVRVLWLKSYKTGFAFRIILMILAVSSVHPQSAYAETLPERLTTENIMDYIRTNEVSTVEGFIEALPPLHKKHFVLVFESEALNPEFVSGDYPRVVSWGGRCSLFIFLANQS